MVHLGCGVGAHIHHSDAPGKQHHGRIVSLDTARADGVAGWGSGIPPDHSSHRDRSQGPRGRWGPGHQSRSSGKGRVPRSVTPVVAQGFRIRPAGPAGEALDGRRRLAVAEAEEVGVLLDAHHVDARWWCERQTSLTTRWAGFRRVLRSGLMSTDVRVSLHGGMLPRHGVPRKYLDSSDTSVTPRRPATPGIRSLRAPDQHDRSIVSSHAAAAQ